MLTWPSSKPSYFIYKPLQKSPTNGSKRAEKVANKLQLLYYKYLLHTGLYMLSPREQASINTIVIVCAVLSLYWLVSFFITL